MAESTTFCRFCVALCGVIVETDGDRVVGVRGDPDHPLSRGYTCPKGRALGAWHHHPRRLDRPRVDGREHSWSDTLADLGARLRTVVEESGPSAVGVHFATGSAFDAAGRRTGEKLLQAIGSRSKYTSTTIDTPCKPLVSLMMSGHPGLVPALDHRDATLPVFIGVNPPVSHGHLNAFPDPIVRLRELARDGREMIVIDPRRTETARLATRHLAVLPGTDYALLAYTIRTLIDSGSIDTAYVERHTWPGELDALRRAVDAFDRESAGAVCGLGGDDLDALADAIRRHGKLAGQTGTGVTMTAPANTIEWLLWALHIITGSYDAPGGMWFNPGYLRCFDRRSASGAAADAPPPLREPGRGPRSRPELANYLGEYPCAALCDEIEAGNLRALVVLGGNLITSLPEPARLAAALGRLDVLAVCDVIDTETTALATHVLPAAGQLERADIPHFIDQFMPTVASMYTPAVMIPMHERKPMWWMLAAIGAELGHDLLPKGTTLDTCTDDDVLGPVADRSRSSFAELAAARVDVRQPAFGWVRERLLPGGRWRLVPEPLAAQLADLAPDRTSGAASSIGALRLAPRRQLRHLNSQLRDVTAPSGRSDSPDVLMHPLDAPAPDGARVRVASAAGSLVGTLKHDAEIRRGAVSVPHGYADVNVGELTSSRLQVDPLSGMVCQSGIEVTVEAIEPL